MKSSLYLTMMAAYAIAGSSHSYGPRGHVSTGVYFTGKRRKEATILPLHESIIKPDIPKGHKTKTCKFFYEVKEHELSIILTISGGSEKSLLKRQHSMARFLKEYVQTTPIEDLIKFNQFEITKK